MTKRPSRKKIMYPFLKKVNDKLSVRLNNELYGEDLINKIIKEEPNSIVSLSSQGNYYFLELDVDSPRDYFDFLNYLIYQNRNK